MGRWARNAEAEEGQSNLGRNVSKPTQKITYRVPWSHTIATDNNLAIRNVFIFLKSTKKNSTPRPQKKSQIPPRVPILPLPYRRSWRNYKRLLLRRFPRLLLLE